MLSLLALEAVNNRQWLAELKELMFVNLMTNII